jgi:hypothetical protein
MWRGPGMELSDKLYAQQPLEGPRGGVVKGSRSSSNVLHLSVDTTRGRITRTLNTSDDAKGIERAKPIVAKAVDEGRIRPNSLAALTYTPPRSTKPVCCRMQLSGNYSTNIGLLDDRARGMSLETGNDELAKDRMRVVVADWLARGLILPTGKVARVYGPDGLDAGFRSDTSRLEAQRWLAEKKRRAAPPFMQWARGPGRKRVLQSAVYLKDGSRLCLGLQTDDTEALGPQRMRVLLWHAISEEQLPKGVKHPAWVLYGGPIPQSTKRLVTKLTSLPWTGYELSRKAAAANLGFSVHTIDWLTKHHETRPETSTAINSRRARLRKDGHQFPKQDSWHFGPVGSVLAIHPGGQIYAQLTITGSTFRWRLKARDPEEAAASVEPVRSVRAQLRKAAEEWGACELGTPASVAAEARVVTACGLYATRLSAIGAPENCIRLAMKPPAEVRSSSLLPVAATRKTMKQVDETKCVEELTKLIKAKERMTIPEVIQWAKQNFGVTRRRAVNDRDCCLNQARKQAKNFRWPPRGRPTG